MTPQQATAFDAANRLNDAAGKMIIHGFRFEAALTLAAAADVPGLSESAQVVLLARAAELLLELRRTQTVH